MRVSPETSQESIETATSEEWATFVVFANKFPSVLESNATYQMKRPPEESDDQPQPPESDVEEPTGLKAIEHRPGGFRRSGSMDDLRGIAVRTDVPPKSDLEATWIVKIGDRVTQIQAGSGRDGS
jgi:hypothetical protein